MTTHLVIADQDTLDRLFIAAQWALIPPDLLEERGGIDTETKDFQWRGEEWLLRTPKEADHLALTGDLSAQFVYCSNSSGSSGGFLAICNGVPTAATKGIRTPPHRRILPLIAACDLLGVDEL